MINSKFKTDFFYINQSTNQLTIKSNNNNIVDYTCIISGN